MPVHPHHPSSATSVDPLADVLRGVRVNERERRERAGEEHVPIGSESSSYHLGGAGLVGNACRVSIGGLAADTDTDELHDFFSLFGIVVNAGVCDEAGSDLGFVEFADPDTAAVVNRQRNLIFNNQIIEVRKPKKYLTYSACGAKTRSESTSRGVKGASSKC